MTLTIKDIPLLERPRERLITYGSETLSNIELLSIILKTGTKGESVYELSKRLLKELGSIYNLKNTNKEILTKIKGIGTAKAVELLATVELGKRIFINNINDSKTKYNNSKIIYENNKYLFLDKKQEYFYCLYLNEKKELIERKLLFMGTINRSCVHPREVFKEAYMRSASSIICIHNHPSGDTKPSREDIHFTKALKEIGDTFGIPVLDHIIVSDNNYYSFYEESNIFIS